MDVRIIEATNRVNHGKFAVGRHSVGEWARPSALPGYEHRRVLDACGWSREHLWVLDLQTGEGLMVRPDGAAHADLNNHRIWVCPLFEEFLHWLYADYRAAPRPEGWWPALPTLVQLPDAPGVLYGRRRRGHSQGGLGVADYRRNKGRPR